MFVDAQLLFDANSTITASQASANIIDQGPAARNLFDGTPLAIILFVKSAGVATGTYQVAVQNSNDPAFGTFTTLSSTTLSATQLGLGQKIVLAMPIGTSIQEYIRLYYTVGGTSPAIGIEAAILPLAMVDKVTYYLDKSPIS